MLRSLLALLLIIASIGGAYYYLAGSKTPVEIQRPEISEAKKAVIQKRAEQKPEHIQDEEDTEEVLDLERYFK